MGLYRYIDICVEIYMILKYHSYIFIFEFVLLVSIIQIFFNSSILIIFYLNKLKNQSWFFCASVLLSLAHHLTILCRFKSCVLYYTTIEQEYNDYYYYRFVRLRVESIQMCLHLYISLIIWTYSVNRLKHQLQMPPPMVWIGKPAESIINCPANEISNATTSTADPTNNSTDKSTEQQVLNINLG